MLESTLSSSATRLVLSAILAWTLSSSRSLADPTNPPRAVPARSVLFPLRQVRLRGGPFGAQQEKNRQYLLKLDPDRLLSLFRKEAGLEPKAPPYRGWESEPPLLYGHILGFFMSGAGMTVQATGDATLKSRLEYIADQLAEVQAANRSGYLLPVPGGKALFAEVAAGNFKVTNPEPNYGYQINGVFEPTYTWNKITLGLYEAYLATGSETARRVLIRTADWFGHDVLDHLDDRKVQELLFCEHGSIHESMVDVYRLTGDPKYLKWARRLCFDRVLGPMAENRGDFLDGYHANCTIPAFTGFERVYRHLGEARLHQAAGHFLDEVIGRRSWVIGGNSAGEHFFPPDEAERALHVPAGPETCNSVNMLRLIEALHESRPTPAALDQYERILWNHLLAAHEPERGMVCYYTPLLPGTYRVYSDEFDSMWCCTGTGLESPGKYAQMIYTHAPDSSAIDVNLFIASELAWDEAGITVRQETGFPEVPSTRLAVVKTPGKPWTLRVRHPSWIPAGALKLELNGQPVDSSTRPGDFAAITREWKPGDSVAVSLPMHLTMERLRNSDRYAAFLYGPIVLSGAFGAGELSRLDFWQIGDTIGRRPVPEATVPTIAAETPAALLDHLEPVPGKPLTFRTTRGFLRPAEQELIPFYRNHYARYAVYWRTLSPDAYDAEVARLEAEAKRFRELDARSIDFVRIGDPVSESAHHLESERSNTGPGAYGRRMESHWRDASPGGWFSYVMKVEPAAGAVLACRYWGRETGARTFDVLADGKTIATTTLGDRGTEDFYTVEVPIPRDLTRGKRTITIRFQGHPGNMSGGLFDVRTLPADPGSEARK
ncbi:beta-L-arabinofuranosidase domain-containing protein [Aquisphaera insulae]|uniref:beta-L-arabinofuranosidase domain-containing protein n=1 Tax=Aquisphaera insulae TaxID=2712864 RepID=UPI0013EE2336|nr:beta-L-arabinofuranosidase domain-containing protein [Aquisphaera insulae]